VKRLFGREIKFLVALFVIFVLMASLLAVGCGNKQVEQKLDQNESQKTDNFPTKPIENIVSWSAGGSSDVAQRLVASFIPKYLNGQSMIVVNKPGGAAVPGTTEIARAKPDGYTIGMNWYASFVLRPYTLDVPYKIEDFEFILGMARQRNALVVRADSPFKTLQDLIDYAKEHPEELKYGHCGTSSWQHLAGEHFNQVAGIETRHVPHDGGRQAVVALLGGHVDYVVAEPPEFLGEIESGDLRALAAFEKERIPALPDVPTFIELGYDVAHPHMMIITAPKGVPENRIKIIHDAYKAVLEDPEFLILAENVGMEIEYKTGEEVLKDIEELDKLYSELIPTVLGDL
jgi:tripartite-type tricarboxylate transporter receptor subunit TctC